MALNVKNRVANTPGIGRYRGQQSGAMNNFENEPNPYGYNIGNSLANIMRNSGGIQGPTAPYEKKPIGPQAVEKPMINLSDTGLNPWVPQPDKNLYSPYGRSGPEEPGTGPADQGSKGALWGILTPKAPPGVSSPQPLVDSAPGSIQGPSLPSKFDEQYRKDLRCRPGDPFCR